MSHVVVDTEHKTLLKARFWNDDGTNIVIVASITKGADWAAYIGTSTVQTEREASIETLKHGCKLLEGDARYFFPDIKLPYRP